MTPNIRPSIALMQAIMRDLTRRTLDAWKVSIEVDRKVDNVWLSLTEPCYAVSAGRWFYTRMHEDGRLPDTDIHATIDGLVAQLNNPAYVREKAARDWRRYLMRRDMPERFDDDPLAQRAYEALRDGKAKWGEW